MPTSNKRSGVAQSESENERVFKEAQGVLSAAMPRYMEANMPEQYGVYMYKKLMQEGRKDDAEAALEKYAPNQFVQYKFKQLMQEGDEAGAEALLKAKAPEKYAQYIVGKETNKALESLGASGLKLADEGGTAIEGSDFQTAAKKLTEAAEQLSAAALRALSAAKSATNDLLTLANANAAVYLAQTAEECRQTAQQMPEIEKQMQQQMSAQSNAEAMLRKLVEGQSGQPSKSRKSGDSGQSMYG